MTLVKDRFATLMVFDKNWKLVGFSKFTRLRHTRIFKELDRGIYNIFAFGLDGWETKGRSTF